MSRALELAVRGQGWVHPNPMVGAILVRGGRIVGEGWHARYGGPHAEIEALNRAGAKAKGATLYVTLEPCAHWGKTPPCTEALIQAGISRVCAAMRDPNPLVAGKGFTQLRRAGLALRLGILEKQSRFLNRAFLTWMVERRPYVTLKAAMSMDGKIATVSGASKWITGPEARRVGHQLRAQCDAIAVGIETVRTDNPSLTTHGNGRNPVRVIFDSRLRLPLKSKVTSRQSRTIVFTTTKVHRPHRLGLEKAGVAVWTIERDRAGHVRLKDALRHLAVEGIAHLLVEGGGRLHASFLEAGLADELVWFIAPKILGGANARTPVEGRGVSSPARAWQLRDVQTERVGLDWCFRARIEPAPR